MEGRGFADTIVSPQHKENEFTGKLALKHVGECLESAFGSNAGLTSTWQPKFAGDSAESVSPARLLYTSMYFVRYATSNWHNRLRLVRGTAGLQKLRSAWLRVINLIPDSQTGLPDLAKHLLILLQEQARNKFRSEANFREPDSRPVCSHHRPRHNSTQATWVQAMEASVSLQQSSAFHY